MINRTAVRALLVVGLLFTFGMTRIATAQAHQDAPAPTGAGTVHAAPPAHAADDRPVVPHDAAAWAGTMLIIILAMFLMAAVIGPMVRMEIPVESHDEHHGHDEHGHGDHGHAHGH